MLLATAIAVLFTTAIRRSPPPAPKVTVTFLGYSNSAASGLLACFAVTNASPGPVIRYVNYGLQSPATTSGRWATLSAGNFTNQGNLKAGDSEVILVSVPTHAPAWRLSLTVSRDEPVRMLAASLVVATRRLLGRKRHPQHQLTSGQLDRGQRGIETRERCALTSMQRAEQVDELWPRLRE